MMTFVWAWMATGYVYGSVAQLQSPMSVQPCRAAEVTLATTMPRVKAGARPEFSVIVRNTSDRSIRVLDVRNGRRDDLQNAYFELFIVEHRRVVDLPRTIADPGPVSDADYAVLEPGGRLEVRPLSYTKAAERLPPGKYSAFILFWHSPDARDSRCRSSEASFEVSH